MRVALVYDHLNKIGGAEVILGELGKLYPGADWYTSVWEPDLVPFSKNWQVHTSWLSKITFLRTHHEWIPFLMPFIFESFDFSGYDLVISVSGAECKGIITRPGTIHINYCLTPTRYLYSHHDEYLSNILYRWVASFLRKWDKIASIRPDIMIAISTQVKKRIKNIYNRDTDIIFPPVDTKKFAMPHLLPTIHDLSSGYYLTVSRLVAYKKIDLLIQTFNQNGKTLVVVGDGAERARLSRLAKPNVILVGSASDIELVGYYQHARAFLQANEEDFGISMCEAQAAGIPVIAYAHGGAADIVINGKTGILVEHASQVEFNRAIDRLETITFDKRVCRANAMRFDKSIWVKQIKERINKL